mgnify:FL=1
MPVKLKIHHQDDFHLVVWERREDEYYFHSKMPIFQDEEEIISKLSSRKKLEWLSSRYLLHLMSGRYDRAKFTKDIHGKPHLEDSDHHVSISHSHEMVAVIASKYLVGIDIQYRVEKIARIQHKFVSEREEKYLLPHDHITGLHIIWGAKEALYKAYGKRLLDFKKHIFIHDLKYEASKGSFKGSVSKDDYTKDFELFYKLFDQYIIVYAKELS